MRKVLVAEDDKFLANAYKIKLNKLGFEVVVVVNGEEALEMLKTYTPDLMLLDLVMPKKDGFAVLAEMKSHPEWKKIPVLVASNLGQKEDIDRAMGMGAVGYVLKTDTSVEDFMLKVRSILQ